MTDKELIQALRDTETRSKRALLDEAASRIERMQWIPVEERLPEDGLVVLCWYEYYRYGEYNAMFATYGIGYQFFGNWGGEVSNGTNTRVLAWMPLPEAPGMR